MCQIKINGNLFNVKTFLSPKDIEKGMMNKTFKDLNCDGALFVMDDDEHHFWMKNCVISLDIVFIDGDKFFYGDTFINSHLVPSFSKSKSTFFVQKIEDSSGLNSLKLNVDNKIEAIEMIHTSESRYVYTGLISFEKKSAEKYLKNRR